MNDSLCVSCRPPRWIWAFLCGGLLVASGCGSGVTPVTGGTAGIIRAGETNLSDVQVTVHRWSGSQAELVGWGVSKPDGTFRLVQPNAKGPLHLSSGEYRVTLESVGAVPVVFPKEYSSAERTPLTVEWTSSMEQIELDVPQPKAGR
jgi:hypothetical protein